MTQNSATSPLNQAISAAIRTVIKFDEAAYKRIYKSYLGVEPLYIPACDDCTDWPPADATISRILKRQTLLVGYLVAPPYVMGDPGDLTGIDADLAPLIAAAICAHYDETKTLRVDWVPAPDVSEAAPEESPLSRLYRGLQKDLYDVVISGQMVMTGSDLPPGVYPIWTCATATIYPTITYTGADDQGKLDLSSLVPPPADRLATRQEFIDLITKHYADKRLTYFSVDNPGPSSPAAVALVTDLNAQGCSALWGCGTVDDSMEAMEDRTFTFVVGDRIANAWQSRQPGFKGIYLNIPATRQAPSVEDKTLVLVAAFTLK